jgi:hypothetical protein
MDNPIYWVSDSDSTLNAFYFNIKLKYNSMKKMILIGMGSVLVLFSCKKKDDGSDQMVVSVPPFQVGQLVNPGDTLNAPKYQTGIKGTLKAGSTYYLYSNYGDVTVNANDTLFLQEDVKVLAVGPDLGKQDKSPAINISGTFVSIGTKDKPNWFTVGDASLKSTGDPQTPSSDNAFKGYWGGIQGQPNSGSIILKWTHVEYVGGPAPTTSSSGAGSPRYGIQYQNTTGIFVFEDSWLYGTVDDGIRIINGNFHIMRNTVEKVGINAGDVFNVKSNSAGNIAYNVVVGGATNACKLSSAGGGNESKTYVYNNLIVNCGFRQADAAHGGSINIEKKGSGSFYNNLIVNCKVGIRIVDADLPNVFYDYNFNYGDDTSITHQFVPIGYNTVAQPHDINGGNLTTPGSNNPKFVAYTLPASPNSWNSVNYVGSANFRLQPGSPALGAGQNDTKALTNVPVDLHFGATTVTPLNKDMGPYPSDNSGNQH